MGREVHNGGEEDRVGINVKLEAHGRRVKGRKLGEGCWKKIISNNSHDYCHRGSLYISYFVIRVFINLCWLIFSPD